MGKELKSVLVDRKRIVYLLNSVNVSLLPNHCTKDGTQHIVLVTVNDDDSVLILRIIVCRRGTKAAIMLIPLFGLQLLITIYRPDPSFSSNQLYEIATAAVANSQVQHSTPFINPFTAAPVKALHFAILI